MRRASKKIILSPKERRELEAFTGSGTRSIKLFKRAEIILALDTSEDRLPAKEGSIAERIGVSRQSIQKVKKDFLASGDLKDFLRRKKRETPPVPAKITGEMEARIIALACSTPPAGFSRWTLRLLADKCVELQFVDSLSPMTISRLLKKLHLNRT